MTSRYDQKAYGMGLYSAGDTYSLTAVVDTTYEDDSMLHRDSDILAVAPSTYNVTSLLEVSGPLSAVVNSSFGVTASMQRERTMTALVPVVATTSAKAEVTYNMIAVVNAEYTIAMDYYIGSYWQAEEINGIWQASPAPPEGNWQEQSIPSVVWRN